MAKKKKLEQIRAEQERVEQELKVRQQNLKILKQKEKELSRKERTHRLCTHGAILEQFLDPNEFNDEQLMEILTMIFGPFTARPFSPFSEEQFSSSSRGKHTLRAIPPYQRHCRHQTEALFRSASESRRRPHTE